MSPARGGWLGRVPVTVNPGPPEVKHWKGAADTNAVTHYAIQQFEDGENVVWMEPGTDAQYAGEAQ